MWTFLRTRFLHFLVGFGISLAALVTYDLGISEATKYVLISAVIGALVSVIIYLLEKRFPERRQGQADD